MTDLHLSPPSSLRAQAKERHLLKSSVLLPLHVMEACRGAGLVEHLTRCVSARLTASAYRPTRTIVGARTLTSLQARKETNTSILQLLCTEPYKGATCNVQFAA